MDNNIQPYSISLKVILKRDDGKVLVMKLPKGYSMEGFYDFPGGRIDKTEFDVDLLDILYREVREEVGDVEVKIGRKLMVNGRGYFKPTTKYNYEEYIFYNFYEGKFIDGSITLSEEHEKFKWVYLEELDLEKHFSQGLLEGVAEYLQQ